MMKNKEKSHLKTQYQKELEGIWNDVAHLIGLMKQMF